MRWWAAGFVVAVVAAGVLVSLNRGDDVGESHAPVVGNTSALTYSNITAADYVGPKACQSCHPERFAAWQNGLHRTMNQLVVGNPAAVLGDFTNARLRYAGGRAIFERVGNTFTMSFARDGQPLRRYVVTRTIGSRYLQEYVGTSTDDAAEVRLPFGYWLGKKAWFPRSYFDSWFPAEYLPNGALALDAYQPDQEPWDSRCAWCHNTYPFELRMARARDTLIGQGREQYVRGGSRSASVDKSRLSVDELVTVGISCESCHLGGREHVSRDEDIRFDPVSPGLQPVSGAPDLSGGRQNSVLINTICAQCHSTPAPQYPHGGVKRNSSEALDMAAGACMSEIKCTDCHDPHQRGAPAGQRNEAPFAAACVRCHEALAKRDAAEAHAGHRSDQASCLDCHMPRVVMGVSWVIRSHRISSPTNEAMLAAGAPNACNLCHLDRSIRWTVNAIEDVHNRRVVARRSWTQHYGDDLAQSLGDVWLGSRDPATRSVAAWAYARRQERSALPKLLRIMDDPIAYYRMFALFAVEALLGRPLTAGEYDAMADPVQRRQQLRELLAGDDRLFP